MRRFLMLMLCSLATPAFAGFGFTRTDSRIVVDTDAQLLFSVDTRNGDLVSLRYRGSELQTTEPKASQIASGLGSAQVEAHTVGDVIVISARAGDLIHYYLAKKGRAAIYMATYAPTLLPVGELRFVARLNVNKLPKADRGTDSNVGTAIEGKDVFLLPDGRTSSKFYSAQPMIDDPLHAVKGPGVAVYMLMGSRELSSGGAFFKDIATQKTPTTHELYNYMYSNHTQTEPYRGGLHGVYGLLFTDGGGPDAALIDVGFVNNSLGLVGFVDSAGRGAVAGHVCGVTNALPMVVGLSNANAEYWARTDGSARFQLTAVRPGQYRMTLYQNELQVAQRTVDVKAGTISQASLQAQPLPGQVKWQIGVPDGTPAGFLNAHLVLTAHPSDSRMASWGPVTYTVGTSTPDEFPAVQWRDVNSPTRIQFVLAANELRAYRLRLFISLAQAGGRPAVIVNQHWTAPVPSASKQPDSRGITRGTYRGNNSVFEVSIPATALQVGVNSLEIGVASGKTGNGFLSPGFVFDSVQWVQ